MWAFLTSQYIFTPTLTQNTLTLHKYKHTNWKLQKKTNLYSTKINFAAPNRNRFFFLLNKKKYACSSAKFDFCFVRFFYILVHTTNNKWLFFSLALFHTEYNQLRHCIFVSGLKPMLPMLPIQTKYVREIENFVCDVYKCLCWKKESSKRNVCYC